MTNSRKDKPLSSNKAKSKAQKIVRLAKPKQRAKFAQASTQRKSQKSTQRQLRYKSAAHHQSAHQRQRYGHFEPKGL